MKNQTTEQTQNQTAEQTQTTTATPAVQYDIDMTFAEQVDAVIEGYYSEPYLRLFDKTPTELMQYGLPNLPLVMPKNKLLGAMGIKKGKQNVHSISVENIKELPKLLKTPIEVLESKTKEGTIVFVLDAFDLNNEIIVCPITPNALYNGIEIDVNMVKTLYGKKNVDTLINTSKVVQKKELDPNEAHGLQLSEYPQKTNSTDSILNKTKKVNPHSQNNSKNNTKYDLADDFRELTDADVSNMGTIIILK